MADRILTTHAGNLPRPNNVSDTLFAREAGETVNPAAFANAVEAAVQEVVAKQRAPGVDIPGVISLFQPNRHYQDDDAYLGALADAMAAEVRGMAWTKLGALAEGAPHASAISWKH